MPSRVVALLLALILFWSGFTTQEQAISLASSNVEQVGAGLPGEVPQHVHDGSVDDHHLDDRPGQAQAEGAADLPALVMMRSDARAPALTMSRPRPYALTAWIAPYLDGPRRPPRAAHLVA